MRVEQYVCLLRSGDGGDASVMVLTVQASKEKVAALMQAAEVRGGGRTSAGDLKSPGQRGWGMGRVRAAVDTQAAM